MSTDSASPATARISTVKGLALLKSPQEGGTKKEYDDFLEKIENHLLVAWVGGPDIGEMLRNNVELKLPPPASLTDDQKKDDFHLLVWQTRVKKYVERTDILEQNKTALYSLIMANVSTITRGKVKAKDGYPTAAAKTDPLWLLNTLEDIMVNFEDEKKEVLALDDQVKRIVALKQGDSSNEDFVKLATKELKIYEKRGSVYLWGKSSNERLSKEIDEENQTHKTANGGKSMTDPELKIVRVRLQKVIQEELMSSVILQRADTKRYATL